MPASPKGAQARTTCPFELRPRSATTASGGQRYARLRCDFRGRVAGRFEIRMELQPMEKQRIERPVLMHVNGDDYYFDANA